MRFYLSSKLRLGVALAGLSVVSVVLFLISSAQNGNFANSYLVWNLGLAWIPLVLVLWLQRILRARLWSSWLPLIVTVAWLSFLPNSFYMITDYIHLGEIVRANPLFDLVMFSSFILNAWILGYLSVFLVHQECIKRLGHRKSTVLIGAAFLLTSFAIYIGRDLRWNTWDVILNPASVLFDVSDRLINPSAHPQVFSTTFSFFVLLSSIYAVIWYFMRAARTQKN